LRLLDYWRDALEHSVELLSHKKHSLFGRFRQLKTQAWLVIMLVFAGALMMPVSMSVLAPAEVVAKNPLVVRAPLEGVIDKVLVQPNQAVKRHTLLLSLDEVPLKSRLDVALQELEIAKAEYRRSEQASVMDRQAATEMPMLAARIEQHAAEVNYVRTLLKRIKIHATQAGVVIMQDAYELEGKPVKLGERLLTLAQPQQAEVEIWLAVGDSLEFADHTPVELFLNVNPETPYLTELRYVNFQAEMSPEGVFAFRTRADFSGSQPIPRLGLRGTAKIIGQQVPLYYYLFRRPWASVRQWLGL
jgi:multidrug resistance efflux pump